jgi:hypothetical protein
MIKIIGILVGSLLLGAAVAAAIVMGIVPLPFGSAAEARRGPDPVFDGQGPVHRAAHRD